MPVVGSSVGEPVATVGVADGGKVGARVGDADGLGVGASVVFVGAAVGADEGAFVTAIASAVLIFGPGIQPPPLA